MPGGVHELAESPEADVRREVLKETGTEVEVGELTGVYKKTARGIVALVFRCKPSGGTERTSEESTAVAWLTHPGRGIRADVRGLRDPPPRRPGSRGPPSAAMTASS
ncbi:conserved hypothetical protein [Streptomyces sp. Mg1]|nr:conserved hypothetical protein [Streptomyces sp. Mg1]